MTPALPFVWTKSKGKDKMGNSGLPFVWVNFLVLFLPSVASANKPVFDVSNSMRLLMLPADASPGSVVYKLRASDADDDYPLRFRVFGNLS